MTAVFFGFQGRHFCSTPEKFLSDNIFEGESGPLILDSFRSVDCLPPRIHRLGPLLRLRLTLLLFSCGGFKLVHLC